MLRIAYYACEATDNPHCSQNTFLQKVFYNGLKIICMVTLTLWLKMVYGLSASKQMPKTKAGDFIVSMTTFPARVGNLWIVIDSIFHQSIRPSKIVLILTQEEFPDGMDAVPHSLKRFLDKGLEVVFVNENLRCHNKYRYVLDKYRDCDVITLDDDLYYWPDTIERLYRLREKNVDCICGNRALRVNVSQGKVSYAHVYNNRGMDIMAQGVGGVLYPPSFRAKELFNHEVVRSLCLSADDNWLRVQETLAGIEAATGDNYPHPLTLLKSQSLALWHKNIGEGQSTVIMEKLLKHYDLIGK